MVILNYVQVRSFILEGTKCLVEAARPLGYLDDSPRDAGEREPVPSPDCNLAALCDMAKRLPLAGAQDSDDEVDVPVQFLPADGVCTAHLDLFSKLTENEADSAVAVTLMGADYIIPPRTSFLLSDFTRIQPLVHCEYFPMCTLQCTSCACSLLYSQPASVQYYVYTLTMCALLICVHSCMEDTPGLELKFPQTQNSLHSIFTQLLVSRTDGKKFDLIVLDPPWENKSVKRSGRYTHYLTWP